jgi:hypothetical protein
MQVVAAAHVHQLVLATRPLRQCPMFPCIGALGHCPWLLKTFTVGAGSCARGSHLAYQHALVRRPLPSIIPSHHLQPTPATHTHGQGSALTPITTGRPPHHKAGAGGFWGTSERPSATPVLWMATTTKHPRPHCTNTPAIHHTRTHGRLHLQPPLPVPVSLAGSLSLADLLGASVACLSASLPLG